MSATKWTPVAWVRYASDGFIHGPILHINMDRVRIDSGKWTPLYATAPARLYAALDKDA